MGRAGTGGAILFVRYFVLALFYPAGMGMGDVKLAGLLGAAMGYLFWATLVVGAFAGVPIGALAGIGWRRGVPAARPASRTGCG